MNANYCVGVAYKMKTAVSKSFGSLFEVEELPDPEPKSNKLGLKVGARGICGTKLLCPITALPREGGGYYRQGAF